MNWISKFEKKNNDDEFKKLPLNDHVTDYYM